MEPLTVEIRMNQVPVFTETYTQYGQGQLALSLLDWVSQVWADKSLLVMQRVAGCHCPDLQRGP
jgi:hypothetical protein